MNTVKGLNTIRDSKRKYRFQSLRERAADVRVDVSRQVLPIHEIERREGAAGGAGDVASSASVSELHRHSIARDELDKLKEMDLSAPFKAFAAKVDNMFLSLPILLHNLETVTKILAKHMKGKLSLATPSILKIVVAVAKDAQQALAPFASPIISAIFHLVTSEAVMLDVPLVSEAFKTAGVVLMQVGKSIVQSDPKLKILRPHYVALLAHHRDFFRRFAADTFLGIIRKLPPAALKAHVKFLISTLVGHDVKKRANPKWQEHLTDGVAMLLCGLLRNVQNRFHSKAGDFMEYFFAAVRPKSMATKKKRKRTVPQAQLCEADRNARHAVLVLTMQLAAEYTRGEHCGVMWSILRDEAKRSMDEMRRATNAAPAAAHASMVLRVMKHWIMHRGGSRLTKDAVDLVLSIAEDCFAMTKRGSNLFCDAQVCYPCPVLRRR